MSFAIATEVIAVAEDRWRATVQPGWDIMGRANGGYLLAIVGRALAEAVGGQPIVMSAHYLAPVGPGPVEVVVAVLRRGRTFTSASASLVADGKTLMHVTATYGQFGGNDGPQLADGGPPELPDVIACVPVIPHESGFPPPFTSRVEMCLHPDDAGFTRGAPSGQARIRGYFRLRADEPHDAFTSLVAIDAFPPPVFNARLPISWTPTVQLTGYLRSLPGPGWLRCLFVTRFVSNGFLEVDGELWNDADTLVAQSRQLALVPRPRTA